jgi:hypothetical protein
MKSRNIVKEEEKRIGVKIIISNKVRSYANDPTIIKRAAEAKKELDKYGLPKELTK